MASSPVRTRQSCPPVVLIVDRDRSLLSEMSEQLHEHGLAVETAASGVECLQKIRTLGGGTVVLNADLPWGGSDGVLAVVREEPELATFQFILAVPRGAPRPNRLVPPVIGILEYPYTATDLLEATLSFVRGTRVCARRGSC